MSKMIIVDGNSNDKDNVRAYMVKGEKGDNGEITYSDVVDNLTSTETQKPLSANQGKVLNEKFEDYYDKTEIDDINNNTTISIYEEYNFHTQFATDYYRSSDELYGMQGGCVLPDGSIIQCTGNNKIIKFGSNGSILNTITANYGHCNGVTYCDKTNTVFITSTQSDTLGRYMIYEIDPSTLGEISSTDLSDKEFPAEPYGLVYIDEIEKFIWCNYWYISNENKHLWITDTNFDLITTKTINVNVRSTSNIGRFGNYIGVNTIKSGKVMLFDYNTLDFFKEVCINELVSDTWYVTEIEWFDTRNGKIYLGFIPFGSTTPTNWGGGTKVIAYYDPTMNYQETGKQNTQFPPNSEKYYVDSSVTLNPLRDGSQNAPFMNINEALNSALRTKNVTGDVSITIKTDETNNYIPIFSMNKTYRIYKEYDTPFKCFGGIAINENAKVYFHEQINLTTDNLFDVYNWGDSHIQNRGILYCDNVICDSANEKLILSSSASSHTTFSINQYGMDVTNMYGDFFDLNNGRITSNTLITPNDNQGNLIKRTIRNVTTELTINSSDNSYQLPLYSNLVIAKIRYELPSSASASDNIRREENIIWKTGEYLEYHIPYFDGTNNKDLKIVISDSGKVTFTPFSDVGYLRIRTTTL